MARTETEAKAIVFIVLARRRQTTSAMKKQTNTKPRRSNSVFQLLVHAFSIGSTFLLLPNRGGVGGGVSAWVATKTSPPTTETVSCCWRWRRSFHFHHTRTVRPTTTTTALAQSSFTPSTGSSPEISVGVVGSSSSLSNSNKAMEFLKKIGKVGGAANRDFRLAIGFDEGSSEKATSSLTMSLAARGGGTTLPKSAVAFPSCVSLSSSGLIDDMSERFPYTSCGTQWAGFTDQVMGGVSTGNVSREIWDGKTANVLRGRVSLANNGGFIQMATNLVAAGSGGEQQQQTSVDASAFLGIELHVQSFKITSENNDDDSDSAHPDESFNVHLKNTACTKPYISYRATFVAPTGQWTTVRIPFASFQGKGQGVEGTSFDTKTLTRLGIVAIGRAMTVQLAVAEVRFYK